MLVLGTTNEPPADEALFAATDDGRDQVGETLPPAVEPAQVGCRNLRHEVVRAGRFHRMQRVRRINDRALQGSDVLGLCMGIEFKAEDHAKLIAVALVDVSHLQFPERNKRYAAATR